MDSCIFKLWLPELTFYASVIENHRVDVYVYADSSQLIAGFQFNTSVVPVTASGGAVGDADFSVSHSTEVILGFSFVGASFDVDGGVTLLEMAFDADTDIQEICLSSPVFSAPSAEALSVEIPSWLACP